LFSGKKYSTDNILKVSSDFNFQAKKVIVTKSKKSDFYGFAFVDCPETKQVRPLRFLQI